MKAQVIRVHCTDVKVGGVKCKCCRPFHSGKLSKRLYNKAVRKFLRLDSERQVQEC